MSDNRTRQELRDWTRARGYWNRATEFLELASNASDPNVQAATSRSHSITARWQRQKNEAQSEKARATFTARVSIAAGPPL